MGDSWNVSRPGVKPSMAAHRLAERNVYAIDWEPVETDKPIVTYARNDTERCMTVIADVRCTFRRWHDGPCAIRVLCETGLVYTVAAGQAGTTAEPAADRVLAALALHVEEDFGTGAEHAAKFCVECCQPAPCATRRALTGVIDLEGATT